MSLNPQEAQMLEIHLEESGGLVRSICLALLLRAAIQLAQLKTGPGKSTRASLAFASG